MKRLIIVGSILFLLVGCGNNQSIEAAYKSGLAQALPISTNHKKPYYRFYLPPHAGVMVQDEISSIFTVSGSEILMNLKVDYIVGTQFEYEQQEKDIKKEPYFEASASYIDVNNMMKSLHVRVYELDTGEFAIFADNDRIEMISVVNKANLNLNLETMIIILKSTEVDDDKVVTAYSNKEINEKKGTYSEFFEQVPPETGTLKEMYDRINPDNQE